MEKGALARSTLFLLHGLLLCCIWFSFQPVHILLGAKAKKYVDAGMLLQLAFLFAEKRHVLSVEVLRQRGDFAI